NELPPDTGASFCRPRPVVSSKQLLRGEHLALSNVLAKGWRPVVDDVGRVPSQRFHLPVESPLTALQRELELPPRHAPKNVQRDVMLPAQPLVLVVGQALPLRGLYASPSSLSPPVSSSSSSLGLISPAASNPSNTLSM